MEILEFTLVGGGRLAVDVLGVDYIQEIVGNDKAVLIGTGHKEFCVEGTYESVLWRFKEAGREEDDEDEDDSSEAWMGPYENN